MQGVSVDLQPTVSRNGISHFPGAGPGEPERCSRACAAAAAACYVPRPPRCPSGRAARRRRRGCRLRAGGRPPWRRTPWRSSCARGTRFGCCGGRGAAAGARSRGGDRPDQPDQPDRARPPRSGSTSRSATAGPSASRLVRSPGLASWGTPIGRAHPSGRMRVATVDESRVATRPRPCPLQSCFGCSPPRLRTSGWTRRGGSGWVAHPCGARERPPHRRRPRMARLSHALHGTKHGAVRPTICLPPSFGEQMGAEGVSNAHSGYHLSARALSARACTPHWMSTHCPAARI